MPGSKAFKPCEKELSFLKTLFSVRASARAGGSRGFKLLLPGNPALQNSVLSHRLV